MQALTLLCTTSCQLSNSHTSLSLFPLQREYVYNKPVVVKGADGREMHKTFKLKTPHQETVSAIFSNPPLPVHLYN